MNKKISNKKGRSPQYPAIDLETALDKIRMLHKKIGKNKSYSHIAMGHLGYSEKSGQGRVVISALVKYGLLNDQGTKKDRVLWLSDLALKIVLDERENSIERDEAIKEAALFPELYKELWNKYNGDVPADEDLRYYLKMELNFTENGANNFIQQFRHTITFANLDNYENNISDSEIDNDKASNRYEEDMHEVNQLNYYKNRENVVLKSYQIPLENDRDAILNLPRPISSTDYETINQWLKLMKNVLVKETKSKQLTNLLDEIKEGESED